MDRTELAWAAGFFDGEGWAGLARESGRLTGQPRAQVNRSSGDGVPPVLERFRAAVRVGVVNGPAIEKGRLPRYWWVVSSRKDVRAVFDAIRPWLSRVKWRAFLAALELPDLSERPVIPDRSEQLAWAAGSFDGEGSIYLAKHRSHPGYLRLEAALTQASSDGVPAVLQQFQQIMGIGPIRGPYPSEPQYQPPYRWKAHRRPQIEAMIALIRPWLGAVKIAQAERAMQVVAAQPQLPRGNAAWGNRKTHCVKGHEYATARIRPFKSRGKNAEPRRASKQCLCCVRESARARRLERKQKSRG